MYTGKFRFFYLKFQFPPYRENVGGLCTIRCFYVWAGGRRRENVWNGCLPDKYLKRIPAVSTEVPLNIRTVCHEMLVMRVFVLELLVTNLTDPKRLVFLEMYCFHVLTVLL